MDDGAGDGYGCGRLYGSGTLECVFVKREKRLDKKKPQISTESA